MGATGRVLNIKRYNLRQNLVGWSFILPTVLFLIVFWAYPAFRTVQISFYRWSGIGVMHWAGLKNYEQLFRLRNDWWGSFGNVGYMILANFVLTNGMALLLAVLMTRRLKKSTTFYRVVFYLPCILSDVVVGQIFRWILDGRFGVLNSVVTGFNHLTGLHLPCDIYWLSDPHYALPAVIGVSIWKGFGWSVIIFLAGLQAIGGEYYEAAEVDGATRWQQFKHITWPLLLPTTIVIYMLTALGTLKTYGLIVTLTNGGPGFHTEVPLTRMISMMYNLPPWDGYGMATAAGLTLGLVMLVFSCLMLWARKRLQS